MAAVGQTGAVRVEGLRELSRAFARADRKVSRELRRELRNAARPVADEAERLAKARIRNMTDDWSEMRVGVTRREVYIVPVERGTKARLRRRPNLNDLLLDEAMEPALDAKREEVVDGIRHVLETVARDWER